MKVRFEFGLLGPLVVRREGALVPVAGGRQGTLLAALLLDANHLVTIGQLTEMLWGDKPPASARAALHNQVRRLRDCLGETGRDRIRTQPGGYLIQVEPDELDVMRMRELLASACSAADGNAWERASAIAAGAMLLWRGEPLAGLDSDVLARRIPDLTETYRQAAEIRLEAEMNLGHHAEAVGELRRFATEQPFREHAYALLMIALYRCGRQGEAIAVYREARQLLIGELGCEPGPELRRVHQQILNDDPVLAAPQPAAAAARDGPIPVVPRELPGAIGNFTGREQELHALTRMLDRGGDDTTAAMAISVIGGMAGVGKTALSVHWAHQVAGRFPEGQLYVDLRGYDPGQPMPTGEALAGFLRSLGVPGQDIPPEEDQRAARYRSLLAGRRVLVVLDNAGSAGQVRPLLPGTSACAVVVTSRDVLAGLAARDGATRLDLDVLPLQEAAALLRALIGARADADPTSVSELAGQCCRLPLALRVAAELAAGHPAVPLAALIGELADLRTRLDLLTTGGDPSTEVRAVFSWSYRHLDADAARTFRLAGLHPGPDFEPYAAAALIGVSMPQARRAVEVLARAHLIQPAAPGRYGMHDLLRAYARELSSSLDTGQEQHAALTRLFDHYLHTAAAAMDTLFPAERHRRPRIPRPATPVPPLADPAAARQWLDHERPTLVAAAGHTAAHDWPGHTTQLAATLFRYLYSGGYYPEALTVFSHALGAARRTGDRTAEATALIQTGIVDREQNRCQQAVDHYRQARTLFRAAGGRAGEARALANMGLAETDLGRYEHAARHEQEAVAIYRDTGDHFGEARALGYLGLARERQGRYQEAASHYQQALDLCREIGDRDGDGWALARLGVVDLRLGRYQPAARYLQQALALFHAMGNRGGEAEILIRLGEVDLGLGRYGQAAGNLEQALAVFREIGSRDLEADALNGLGDVHFQTGDAGKARERYATALRLASEADAPREQARAHSGLARACQADGDPDHARHHWQEALTRYTAIGAPEAAEIRAFLATSRPL